MRHLRSETVVIALAALACKMLPVEAEASAAPTWKGSYRYEFNGGRTAGESAIVVTHDLIIVPGAARGGCQLASSGFQTSERIVCHASGDAKMLTVTFHGYDDGRTVNKFGIAVYKPGQTMLALERSVSGKVLTQWEGFHPDLPAEAPNPGEYFRPTR